MGREQSTLWPFAGGLDPAELDTADKDEIRSKGKVVKLGGPDSGELGLKLKRDLIEWLDPQLLETGEGRRRLRLQPQQADWADAMYIRAEPTEENLKFDYVIRNPESYPAVVLPTAWRRNDVVNGIDNPFHKARSGDRTTVRYLPEGAIEIYTEEVFNANPRFVRLRALGAFAGLVLADSEPVNYSNPAAVTPYDGQMFEIVPFDLDVFFKHFRSSSGRDLSESQGGRLTPDDFTHILTEGGIKPCSTQVMQIHWGTKFTPQNEIVLLERETARLRVVLPTYGMVHLCTYPVAPRELPMLIHRSHDHRITDSAVEDSGFWVSDETGTTRINRKYLARIDEEWWGRFFETPEHRPPIIYIPADPKSPFSPFDPIDPF